MPNASGSGKAWVGVAVEFDVELVVAVEVRHHVWATVNDLAIDGNAAEKS